MDIPEKYLRNLKFIVIADARTGQDLALFFDYTLPDMHKELFAKAKNEWAKNGHYITVHGGGRFSVIENTVVFYGRSLDFGRYEDKVVLLLAPEHQCFVQKNYRFISKAGADDALTVLKFFDK